MFNLPQLMKDIITTSRTLELAGLCISLVTTVISLVIFCYFRYVDLQHVTPWKARETWKSKT